MTRLSLFSVSAGACRNIWSLKSGGKEAAQGRVDLAGALLAVVIDSGLARGGVSGCRSLGVVYANRQGAGILTLSLFGSSSFMSLLMFKLQLGGSNRVRSRFFRSRWFFSSLRLD